MFKNLLNTLLRFKTSSTLNIIGLSVAYAAFVMILMQVQYEYSYGTDDPNHKRIYRIETARSDGTWGKLIDEHITAYLEQNESMVEALAVFGSTVPDIFVATGTDQEPSVPATMVFMESDITRVFAFDMLEGAAPAMDRKEDVMIPQSLARALFGKESALGRTIYTKLNSATSRAAMQKQLQIAGVYRDFGQSSVLTNSIYHTPQWSQALPEDNNYVLLGVGADTTALLDSYRRNFKAETHNSSNIIRMTRCDQTYFLADMDRYDSSSDKGGSKATTDLLGAICILIVMIALINYINFSTALAPQRLRGLNIRAVFGVTRMRLRLMLIVESLGMAMIAYVVALLIVGTLNDTSVVRLLRVPDPSLGANLPTVLLGGALAAVMGIIVGIYPAYFMTRFEPALVLKGCGGGAAPRGRWLRTGLIGFQYLASMALIIAALFVWLQNSYLRTSPLGFNRENVLEVTMGLGDDDLASARRFEEQLMRHPAIKAVTFTRGKIGRGSTSKIQINPADVEPFEINLDAVEPDFLDAMQIPIIAGRNFRDNDIAHGLRWHSVVNGNPQSPPAVIITRTAQRMGNIQIDSLIDGRYRVVGVCEDLHYSSMREAVGPFGFVASPNNWRCYIRVNAGPIDGQGLAESESMDKVISSIGTEYDKLENTRDKFNCKMLDDSLNEQYAKENDLGLMITLFTILAIMISLVGVFGLVLFETQCRRREIALRKVHGASVTQVLGMFGRSFMVLVVICFILAAPIAWWGVERWLSEFAYRTPMYWWVFLAAFVIVFIITALTVLIQAWRTATANPVESLKSE